MAEDSTRRLLRAFGIAATDCDEALEALTAELGTAPAPGRAAEAVEAYGRATRELGARWAEVGGVLQGYQTRAQAAIEGYLRAAGGPR